jgi:hypothetical protein
MNHFSAFSIHFNVTFSDCPQFVVDGWGRRRFRAPVARLQGEKNLWSDQLRKIPDRILLPFGFGGGQEVSHPTFRKSNTG